VFEFANLLLKITVKKDPAFRKNATVPVCEEILDKSLASETLCIVYILMLSTARHFLGNFQFELFCVPVFTQHKKKVGK
jgi:hypothetical protein